MQFSGESGQQVTRRRRARRPCIVPVSAKKLVILVSLVETKSSEFLNKSGKSLMGLDWRRRRESDSKSRGVNAPCGFDSHLRQIISSQARASPGRGCSCSRYFFAASWIIAASSLLVVLRHVPQPGRIFADVVAGRELPEQIAVLLASWSRSRAAAPRARRSPACSVGPSALNFSISWRMRSFSAAVRCGSLPNWMPIEYSGRGFFCVDGVAEML